MDRDSNTAFFSLFLGVAGGLALFGQAQAPASGDAVEVDTSVLEWLDLT